MIGDIDGVGGFFEDLPVLVFVLSGVALLLGSVAWSSAQVIAAENHEQLTSVANRLADSISELAGGRHDEEFCASIEHIRSMNVCARAAEITMGRSFLFSAVQIHPCILWLTASGSSPTGVSDRAASASRLVNAIDESGRFVVVEVRVVVW